MAARTVADLDAAPAGNPFGYGARVWQLFRAAPRAGSFPPGTPGVLVGRAGTRASRSVLQLSLRIEGERIADARFRAYGCPTSIAVGAWLCEWSIGRTPAELRALRAGALREALEIPDDRAHCALMGEDALHAALAATNAGSPLP